jgi:hypothetical protein
MRMSRIMETDLLWFSHSALSARKKLSPCSAAIFSATTKRWADSVATRPR